jgi:hypothetical protein
VNVAVADPPPAVTVNPPDTEGGSVTGKSANAPDASVVGSTDADHGSPESSSTTTLTVESAVHPEPPRRAVSPIWYEPWSVETDGEVCASDGIAVRKMV